MALSSLTTQSVGLPKSGTYNVKYTVLADAPYQQHATNAALTTITYNTNGTFTLGGKTYTPTYVMKTAISSYSPSYPMMVINVNGTKFLIADPSFDLSQWTFTMPSMVGQTSIAISKTGVTGAQASLYNTSFAAGSSGWTGMSSSPVAPPPDPEPKPTPTGYLPSTIDNVYVYTLNTDGTVAAQNSNTAIGPLTAQYDGTTWKYVNAQGVAVLTGPGTTTGVYQLENGFISYNSSGQYVLVSNDKITDPSKVKWSNEAGTVPGTAGFPTFAGESSMLKLQNLEGTEVIFYERISGGVTNSSGYYLKDGHLNMPCFLAGTMILTASGYKPVEALELSDEIAIFADSEVKWCKIKALSTGVCTINDSSYPDLAGYPVVITQNALGRGVPFKNLRITADHAIEIDGELYLARTLVDGEKIYFDQTVKSYPYYHIDLHDHHVIDANGARAESYGDNGYRNIFNNADIRFNKEHPFDSPISFRPACQDPSKILATRQKLDLRPTSVKLPASLDFKLMTDEGEELPAETVNGTCWSFVIPPYVDTVRMVSATARPYDAIGTHVDDRRRLGLLVDDITLIESTGIVKYDEHLSKRYCHGWSTLDNASCRWTAGNARIHLSRKDSTDTAILTINVVNNCLNLGK